MKRIQGMTLIGMLSAAIIAVVLVIIVMKVVPIYINHYQVTSAVNGLSSVSSDRFTHSVAENAMQIKRTLINQLYINNISTVKPKDLVIKPINYKEFRIIIDYEVKETLVSNISLLVHFKIDKEVEINAP